MPGRFPGPLRSHESVRRHANFTSNASLMTKESLHNLADGMGTRYGGPQQLEPIGPRGKTIFNHLPSRLMVFLPAQPACEEAEFFLPSLVTTLIGNAKKRVKVLPARAAWFGVTSRAERPSVIAGIRKLVAHGDYPERLWS